MEVVILSDIILIIITVVLAMVLSIIGSMVYDGLGFDIQIFGLLFSLSITILVWQNILPYYFYLVPAFVLTIAFLRRG